MKISIIKDWEKQRRMPKGGLEEFERLIDEFVDSGAEAAEIDFSDRYKNAKSAFCGAARVIRLQGRDSFIRASTVGGKLIIMRYAEV